MPNRAGSVRFCLLLTAILLLAFGLPLPGQEQQAPNPSDWPQFRGHDVDGISKETDIFKTPVVLDVEWKVPLGSGYSGVSVAHGLAVTMFDDGEATVVIAFDAATGRERWRFPMSPTYKGRDGSYDGPMSTPLITGNMTVALGPAGAMVALGNETGSLVWSTHLVNDHDAPKPLYGFATSPILEGDNIVLQIGGENGSVAGFDPVSGERRWRSGQDAVDYQNAVPFTRDGQRYVVAAGFGKLMGVDPESGAVLWESEHGGGGARGVWSMVPVVAGDDEIFLAFKDNSSALFKLDGTSTAVTSHQQWEERTIRNSYAVAVHHEGYLYAYSSRFLTCVNVATGKAMWKSRPPGDGFVILVDGHLVIQTKAGGLHVAMASPDGYEEVAGLKLFDELAWTPPSFADGSIFVRSLTELARVNVRTGPATLPTEDESAATVDAGGSFAGFLKQVAAATDKSQVVDNFLAAQTGFPIIEENKRVHFVYRGPAEDMAIGGDMVGSRQETPMIRVGGTDLFYYSTELLPDARVNYLLFRDFEQMLDPLNPRVTKTAVFSSDMEMAAAGNQVEMEMSWLAMPGWKSPAHLEEPPEGTARGRLDRRQLHSDILDLDHILTVYLPAGYDESSARYTVIYMHGGPGALKRGRWPTTLDNLVGSAIEPVIVAFIEPFAGHIFQSRDTYGEFWATELIPFMDGAYRTDASAEGRANAGAGQGAHEALHCAFKYPELSSRVAIQSLTMVDFGWNLLEPLITNAAERPLQIYVEWGAYDRHNPQEAWDVREFNRELVDFLRTRGYRVDTSEVADGTGWPSWKYRNDTVLKHLFPAEPRR